MQYRYMVHGALGSAPTTEEGATLPYTTQQACVANDGRWQNAASGPGGACMRIAPVETLAPGESPTPTPDQAVPGAGVAPPAGDPNGPFMEREVFGVPTKYLLMGGAGLAALLLLTK